MQSTLAEPLPLSDTVSQQRSAVNLRSVLVGMVGVIILSAIAPFNDLVLANSAMIGGSLPVGAVFLFCCFAILVNGPLSRFAPGRAMSTGELAVVFIMVLVSSAIPTRGLMQMWPATVIGVSYHGGENADYRSVLKLLALPNWFWPGTTAERGPTDPLIAWFYGRMPDSATTTDVHKVISGWIAPTLGWGVFFVGLAAAVIGLSVIAARQWVQNERIAFPIATVELALVRAPAPGRWLNGTISSRAFHIGLAAVLVVRTLQGLRTYFPTYVPDVSLGYNLRNIFAEPPFSYIDGWITLQTVYPLVIAMTFFIATRISFSLWACVVMSQIPNLITEPMGASMSPHRSEINLGGLLAFATMMFFSGRHYYWQTIKSLILPVRESNVHSTPVSRPAAYAAVAGTGIAIGWLVYCHMPFFPAVLLIGSLLLIWILLANVVAQSGLLVANTLATPHEWFSRAFTNPGGLAAINVGDVRTQFFAQIIGGMWAYNSDHLSVYTTHSMAISNQAAPTAGKKLFLAMVAALLIGFITSLGSTLWCEYRFSITADSKQTMPLNAEIINGQPKWGMDFTVRTMRTGLAKAGPATPSWPWVTGSAGLTGAAAFLQLRYSAWPIHPIGLLMMYSYPMRRIWFSVFLGWLLKSIVVKYGGATTLRKAEPLLIGVVVGEVFAAALLTLIAVILWACGIQFQTLNTLPTSQY